MIMASISKKGVSSEEYIDAVNQFNDCSIVELTEGIKSAQEALDLFLNNHFEAAKNKLEPSSGSNLYSSLGYSAVMFLQAVITMESQQMDDASNAIKVCLNFCQKNRRKSTFAESLKIRNKSSQLLEYAKYTDYQCHVELCYAECLLQKAFLTFIQDESLLALIKGSLKIRECYMTYKVCWNILKVKQWTNEFIKSTFEYGARLGVGAFNLMISMLPTRILKLLEFVGFKGNQIFGINEMNKAAYNENNLRQPLASLLLLGYHCFVGVIVGMYPYTDHINEAKKLLSPCMKKYSSSALFGMLRARIDLICGKFDEAMIGYENSISSQNEWRNLHDICHWELLWCYVLQGDWLLGMKFAEKLSQHSRWSKSTYLYQKGVFLLQCYEGSAEIVNEDMKTHIRKLFESVPKLLQRFAGKSLPIEKFAAKKSKRFFEQGENLILPGVELIFVWNGFKIMAYNPPCVEIFLALCNETIIKLERITDKSAFYYDNIALATLLKAVCLRYLGQLSEAIDLMNTVLSYGKKIKEDLYILPYTEVELAQIAFTQFRYEDVKTHLTNAKSYKGYSLESRLHFRIHGINLYLNQLKSPGSTVESEDSWDNPSLHDSGNNNENIMDIESFQDCESDIEKDNNNHSDTLSNVSNCMVEKF